MPANAAGGAGGAGAAGAAGAADAAGGEGVLRGGVTKEDIGEGGNCGDGVAIRGQQNINKISTKASGFTLFGAGPAIVFNPAIFVFFLNSSGHALGSRFW